MVGMSFENSNPAIHPVMTGQSRSLSREKMVRAILRRSTAHLWYCPKITPPSLRERERERERERDAKEMHPSVYPTLRGHQITSSARAITISQASKKSQLSLLMLTTIEFSRSGRGAKLSLEPPQDVARHKNWQTRKSMLFAFRNERRGGKLVCSPRRRDFGRGRPKVE